MIYIFRNKNKSHTVTTLTFPGSSPGLITVDEMEFKIDHAPTKYCLWFPRSVVLRSKIVTCCLKARIKWL